MSWQSCTASSPFFGHSEPAGKSPAPLQIGPSIQYVASPSTDTSVHVSDCSVVAAGVALGVVAAGVALGLEAAGVAPGVVAAGVVLGLEAAGVAPGVVTAGVAPGVVAAGVAPGVVAAGVAPGVSVPVDPDADDSVEV